MSCVTKAVRNAAHALVPTTQTKVYFVSRYTLRLICFKTELFHSPIFVQGVLKRYSYI